MIAITTRSSTRLKPPRCPATIRAPVRVRRSMRHP